MPCRAALFFVLASLAFAQDASQRSKASDFPVHVELSNLDIGVEYLLHSIPTPNGFVVARDFLVVEVAMFPHNGSVAIAQGQFTMRVNGKKLLTPATPGMVAASIKYPDWDSRPAASVEAGTPNGSVILGGPTAVPRFPGDRRAGPTVPNPGDPGTVGGIENKSTKPIEEVLTESSLPDVRAEKLVRGCIYFQFEGKTKSIKKLELLYDTGKAGVQATIPII